MTSFSNLFERPPVIYDHFYVTGIWGLVKLRFYRSNVKNMLHWVADLQAITVLILMEILLSNKP